MSTQTVGAVEIGRVLAGAGPLRQRLAWAVGLLAAQPGVAGARLRVDGFCSGAGTLAGTGPAPQALRVDVPAGEHTGELLVALADPAQPEPELVGFAAALLGVACCDGVGAGGEAAGLLSDPVHRASLDAVVAMDQDGWIIDVNPAAEALFGHRREAMVGRLLADVVIPERLRAAHLDGLRHYLTVGRPQVLNRRVEMPGVHADGHELTVELTVTDAEAGGRRVFLGFMRDITDLRRAQHALRLSEQRYRAVVEHSPVVITLVHPDGSWQTPSAWVTSVLGGWPAGDDIEVLMRRVHPDDQAPLREYLHRLLRREPVPDGELELRMRAVDGGWRTTATVAEDLLDHPAVNAVVLHSRDITPLVRARAGLQASNTRLATVISAMSAGVLLENEQRRIVLTNRAFTSMFRLPVEPEQLRGYDCASAAEQSGQLFTEPDRFVASITEAVAGGTARTDEEFELVDGRVVQRDYVPVWSGSEFLGHLWLYRDVTQRRRYERSLTERNEALAELAELRTRFVATVSHELRTPLSSVLGFAELLLDDDAEPLSDEQREGVRAIERNAHRLLHLVADLLLLARLESATLSLQLGPVDVGQLTRTVLAEQAPPAAAGVELVDEVPPGLVVRADAARLQQVLDNLVSNALKFTPAGGRVSVSAHRDGPRWSWTVRDTGVGVPATDLPHLFDSFFRAANVRGRYAGTGLGLSICRAVVERHGGTIEARSVEGEGTTMTVTLPVDPGRVEDA